MPTLEITTNIGCSLRCYYCPQDLLIKAYYARHESSSGGSKPPQYLSFDNYKIIIDKLPEYVRIHFSGKSEPWLNPDCTRMLQYSLEKGHRIAIFTTLVGMKEEDADITCGLLRQYTDKIHKICIHLPDAANHMPGWKKSKTWDYALEQFLALDREKSLLPFVWMTMDGQGRIHPDVTSKHIPLTDSRFNSRGGALGDGKVKSPEINSPVVCGRSIFYDRNSLLPNGDIALCAMDYGLKHILGNILLEEYQQIQEKKTIFAKNAMFGVDKSICKYCEYAIEFVLNKNQDWRKKDSPEYNLSQLMHHCKKTIKFYYSKMIQRWKSPKYKGISCFSVLCIY